MRSSLLILLLLLSFSCSTARIRRLNPDSVVTSSGKKFDLYHSKRKLANLEITFSEGENNDLNDATLKATLENTSAEDLTINLKDTYQWSAWFRWQRRPKWTSAEVIVLKPHERHEVSFIWMRREFGVMIMPFLVGSQHDEIQVKFENCSPWGKCETEFTK